MDVDGIIKIVGSSDDKPNEKNKNADSQGSLTQLTVFAYTVNFYFNAQF